MRIQKEIENVERVKDKIATMPLTMEDAIEFHKQVVDRVEKERKEINKELDLDDDIEEKGFTGASKEPKKVSTPELKKMKLSESLFEYFTFPTNIYKNIVDPIIMDAGTTCQMDVADIDVSYYDPNVIYLFNISKKEADRFFSYLENKGIQCWDFRQLKGYSARFDISKLKGSKLSESLFSESLNEEFSSDKGWGDYLNDEILYEVDNSIEELNFIRDKLIKAKNGTFTNYSAVELYDDIHYAGEDLKILASVVLEHSKIINESVSLNEGIKGINLKDYDDGYVEMRDGVPQFVYDSLRDARNGIVWSIRGDHEDGDRKDHKYEIKQWKNGELVDLSESLNESLSIEWWNNSKNKKAAEKVVLKEYSNHMTQEKANKISVNAKSYEIDVDIPYNILSGISEWVDKKACEKLNNFFKKNNVNIKAKEMSYMNYIWFELDFGEDGEFDESLNECDKFKKGDCKNYALDEAKISRQNQRRKREANLKRKEAEREKAEEEARKRERIGDDVWSEKDWIAEREKGDLDFSNYSDEERAEIEKRLKAFDDNKTAQAQYQRKKEAEERRKAEEERKKAEQEKEEKTKKNIEVVGKVANAPKDIANAFKKGFKDSGINIG